MWEVRIRQVPDRFDGKRWHTKPQRLTAVKSDAWMLVRSADYPGAMPLVVSRKEWAKMEIEQVARTKEGTRDHE